MAELSQEEVHGGVLLVYGNPLLDIIVNNPSGPVLLEKYNLKPNNSIAADDQHMQLFQDVEEPWTEPRQYLLGGAALNVARTVQWLTRRSGVTTFFGGIGSDRHGDILRTEMSKTGVRAMFHVTDSEPSGTCVTICSGANRSMVSRMAGSGSFSEADLNVPCHWSMVEKADVFYAVSYSLSTNASVLFSLASHAAKRRKTFCLNLSAPWLCRRFKESMDRLLPFVHFLFGNQSETVRRELSISGLHGDQLREEMAVLSFIEGITLDLSSSTKELDAFCEVRGLEGSRRELVKAVADCPRHDNERSRVVVITQGSGPVLVAAGPTVTEHQGPTVAAEDIVDTSGAGDAFVGGFLTQLLRHQPVEQCVGCGLYASSVVVHRPGCSFPRASSDTASRSTDL